MITRPADVGMEVHWVEETRDEARGLGVYMCIQMMHCEQKANVLGLSQGRNVASQCRVTAETCRSAAVSLTCQGDAVVMVAGNGDGDGDSAVR